MAEFGPIGLILGPQVDAYREGLEGETGIFFIEFDTFIRVRKRKLKM